MMIISDYQKYLPNFSYVENCENIRFVTNNSNLAFSLTELDWDSKVLKRKVGKISDFFGELSINDSSEFIDFIIHIINEQCYDLVYYRGSYSPIQFSVLLQKCGFFVCDILSVLSSDDTTIFKTDEFNYNQKMIVGYSDRYYQRIKEIASHSFVNSRIYNDPYLSSYGDVFYDNLAASFVNSAYLKVAVVNNEVAGFVVGQNDSRYNDLCYLSLIGVDEKYRKIGLGNELFKAFLQDFGSNNSNVEIGTQINNFQATNLYSKYGFKIVDNLITMHWHKKW